MRERLIGLLSGFMPVQLAYVMARLELADLLGGGSLTVGELSAATHTRPDLLRRLLRGLAGVGLVGLGTGDRVSLTEMGALLGSRTPGSLRDLALHRGGESFAAWGELEHAVRSGEPAFEAAHGAPFFDYLRSNPEAGAAFDGTMARLSDRVVREAVAHYDFGEASRVLDVGGGRGHFVAAVLEEHPELEGAVFDVPYVSGAACEYLRGRGLGDRSLAIGGNFFERVPAGYDLHILKWILHDWDDEACGELLAACRAALPDDGRLLVVEQLLPDVVPDSGELHPAVAMDLIMLVNFADARERRLHEYEALLTGAGFAIHAVVALPSGFSILDCRIASTSRVPEAGRSARTSPG
jgi:orsellinic acid C2-O-methyltransferase